MSQTVARAIDIIGFVAHQPRPLNDVAEHLGVHKSTALRILQTLEGAGFVRKDAGGHYVMGFQLIAYGQLALDQVEARSLAHPVLQELAERHGHTVHLGELVGDHIVYIDKVDGRGSVAMGSRIGLRAQTHTAGVAKVITAYQAPAIRERILDQATFERFTDTTHTSRESLVADLNQTRARGWAEDDGEHEGYINCVAVPVRDARGKVTHGVSVTALSAVASLAELRSHVDEFRSAAQQISAELGWKGHTP
ncbi:IclR family transcriptional regulator [Streptomyces sp. RKCA744]|uniref:IclR family transcriptional regulator n=1 Tax=Streptomyces sp. RKCA744 TaxID=2959340 RepID=UPI00209FE867|nr:IclR family transcriptional regulator [Streptomyces sp. RKCA744]MCO8307748.1 IclR family transcriptional regulator [Streptomyces sp. RKCA744]